MATDIDPREAQVDSPQDAKPNFEISKWTAVAFWSWDIDVDNCAICRNHIMEPCVNCQQEATFNSEHECVAAWGECNHAFHLHCITQWIKSRNVCPLDNKPWKLARCGK